jgi:type IV pilus assembly protein PilA
MKPETNQNRGFTLIELMIVIAILTMLATLAVPSFQERVIQGQVGEGVKLVEFAQRAVDDYWRTHHAMPADNAAAGLPPADQIVGNYVAGVRVADGAIVIAYGNKSNRNLAGKQLAIRPAVVEKFPTVPIAWICGSSEVPDKMTVRGTNATDLPSMFLPLDCRPGPGAAPKN